MEKETEVAVTTEVTAPLEPKSIEQTHPEPSPEPRQDAAQHTSDDNVRKRIDKLVWQREEERRQNQDLKRELEELKAKPKEQETPQANPLKPSPQWNPKTGKAFDTWDDYTEALTDWKLEQKFSSLKEEATKKQRQEAMQKARTEYDKRAAKARQKYPDYDEHFENATISEAMGRAIIGSESGPQIVIYLSKNPEVADRLYELSETAAAREIGKIEAKLDELLQDKTTTEAPAPIKPVRGKSEASNEPKDSDDIKTWKAKRNKQLGRA